MHVEETNEINVFKKLTISEQLMYLIESITHVNESKHFQEKKAHSVIGSLVADLLFLHKLDLTNNKITIIDGEKVNSDYLDNFLIELQTNYAGRSIKELMEDFKKVDNLEGKIRTVLIRKKLLEGKRKIFSFKGSKETFIHDTVLLRRNMWSINLALRDNSEPELKTVSLVVLLDAIDFLKNFFKSSDDFAEKETRLIELLEKNPDLKLIHDTIRSINPVQDEKELNEFADQIVFQ